jgi:hypothetical protein
MDCFLSSAGRGHFAHGEGMVVNGESWTCAQAAKGGL